MAFSEMPEQSLPVDVEEYYHSVVGPEIQHTFRNLDDIATLDFSMTAVQSSSTYNFVVDFSDFASWVSFDLSTPSVAALLARDRPEALNTRWINIWYPSQHRRLLELLAKRYDFSPRLLALMCSDPTQATKSQSNTETQEKRHRLPWHASHAKSDLEKGPDELSKHTSISSHESVTGHNLYRIINDLWHYSSIDFGRNYVCIGHNSLYGTRHGGEQPGEGPLPHCTRVWTWLVLCEDKTVISINEDPFPFAEGRLDPLQQRILYETRRNLVTVFRSLSMAQQEPPQTGPLPTTLLPLRARLGDTPEETAHRQTDVPGLLFYYLFENWHNSYTLIPRIESRYGMELKKLRAEMFELPKLCHIDRLDNIGKELGVLKRHYQSYNRIIERLLEPVTTTTASLQNSRVMSAASETSLDTVRPLITEKESMLGVALSSPARARFKRLRDDIELYALNEVEEYIKQKDSLVTMNFNLIAIKESLDVERLTRITLLLTKVTIIFLPVSLMTAYFSVNLVNAVYTVKEYWISFAVIMFLSWAMLFVFGVFSGSVQTITFWRELRKGLKRAWRSAPSKL